MRAAAYARFSTANQTNNSIMYQMAKIQEHCTKNGITIAAAGRKEFDAVVVYDITRGSRDVADWFTFRKLMKQLGVEAISVEDKLGDILDPNDFLMKLLSVGIGQHTVLTTRQKSIDGTTIKAKEGVFLSGVAPLGYDILEGKYIINDREAAIVRTIFDMYAKGESYAVILGSIGGAKGKRGQTIGKNSLNCILKNERYIGVYTWNKHKVKVIRKWVGGGLNPKCVRLEGAIPAIIDMDTCKRMEANKKGTNKAKRNYLLSGLIECERCGSTFVGHTSTNGRGNEHRYYMCGSKYRTRTCKAPKVNIDEIETFVVIQLKEYLTTIDYEEMAGVISR